MKEKRLFLLDMDGTIYRSHFLFPETKPFLERVRALGGKYLFLTNNSSRSVRSYVGKLTDMGIACTADNFVTSVDVTILYLQEHLPGKKVYALGTASFREQLTAAGICVTHELTDDIDVLLMGFDTELTFQKLQDACILLGRGVSYVATHPDLVCPTEYGSVPDCGSLAQMLCNATGRMPVVIGKPRPEMVYQAMKKTGIGAAQTVLIGDRLNTDIAAGYNAGIDTVLVLSGESQMEHVEKSPVKPTHIVPNIGQLLV